MYPLYTVLPYIGKLQKYIMYTEHILPHHLPSYLSFSLCPVIPFVSLERLASTFIPCIHV